MAVSAKLKSLVAQMPDPDGQGMFTENIDKEKIERAVAQIAAGGRQNVEGLVEMLGQPGSKEDVKPHYALHCLTNYTLVAGGEQARKEFCDVLVAKLSDDLAASTKAFLCQELQWAGHGEAAPALGRLLLDPGLVAPAAMALVAIRQGAADQFLAVLPKAEGKCRLAIVDGLAALADPRSAGALKDAVKDADREVRIAAGAGLAALGDAGSVDLLLGAADAPPGWERIQQTRHCIMLAEKLAAAGKNAEAGKIYNHLRSTRKDPSEKYIRDAAEKALAAV